APDRVSLRVSPDMRLRFERGDSGWVQHAEPISWTMTRLRVTGTIETSLYEALDRALPDSFLPAAERRSLAWAIADVYEWQVDFTRDVRANDRFRVVLERLESPEGERRFGRILAADVEVAHTSQFAFFFSDESGRVAGFFDERGRSLKRAFLRAPLQFRRI